MAVVIHELSLWLESVTDPITSFAVDLLTFWKPEDMPMAGDLVVMEVREPRRPVTLPYGWTVGDEEGRSCWKVWTGTEPTTVVFRAPGVRRWDVRGYVVKAGTYVLGGADSGTAVSPPESDAT